MFAKLVAKMKDEKGQALAEYGLILALIAVVCVTALTVLGEGVQATLTAIASELTGAGG